MADILNNPSNEGTQPTTVDTTTVQPQPTVVPEEQYKSLQSDYTKRVESEIALATKLVKANPNELKALSDPRVQNAVAKQLYGVDTYAQLIAVYGENFATPSEDENLDVTTRLEREVRMLKFNSESQILDSAIEAFVSQNKDLITSPEDEVKLRDELKYISTDLPVKERIRRASVIVFGSGNPEANAYRQIATRTQVN